MKGKREADGIDTQERASNNANWIEIYVSVDIGVTAICRCIAACFELIARA